MTFFECYADESLLRALGFTSKELRGGHSGGRSKVSQKLKEASNSLGLIDEDPLSPRDSYLNWLFSLPPAYEDSYFVLLRDSKNNNRVVVIRPNLEAWASKIARERRVDLNERKYALSTDADKLHDLLAPKYNTAKRDKFIEFIKDIADHQSIVKLKELLKS